MEAASVWLRRDPAASNLRAYGAKRAVAGDLLGLTMKGQGEDATWRDEVGSRKD